MADGTYELNAGVGTRGLGKGAFAHLVYNVVPKEVHPRAVLPEGLVFKDGALLASKVFRVENGISYDHSGRYAAFADFEYSGP